LILRFNVLVTFDMNGRWHCSGNNTTEVIRVHSLTRSPLVNFIFFEIPNLDDWNHLDGNPGFFLWQPVREPSTRNVNFRWHSSPAIDRINLVSEFT
jgi:hypothetical protein